MYSRLLSCSQSCQPRCSPPAAGSRVPAGCRRSRSFGGNDAMAFSGAKLACAALAILAGLAASDVAVAQSNETWKSFRPDVFGERPIQENSPLVVLTAPSRADDAALVPVEVRAALAPGDSRTIAKITVIVDEN